MSEIRKVELGARDGSKDDWKAVGRLVRPNSRATIINGVKMYSISQTNAADAEKQRKEEEEVARLWLQG